MTMLRMVGIKTDGFFTY